MKKINLNTSLIKLAIVINLILISCNVKASCIYQDFQGWKDCFIKEKLSTNINSVDLDSFHKAQFLPKIIELDKNQPEKKLTFQQYIENIGIEKIKHKIVKGREFYDQHYDLINQIGEDYNIEPEILVALVGMESNYGTNKGSYNVIDALASLSYDGRRRDFFEKELVKVLQIARNENLDYEELKGSWAGAMGWVQFMPSSYLNYAIDYDQDGKADIWNSTADALASAANYLKRNGWKYGHSFIKDVSHLERDTQCPSGQTICDLADNSKLILLKDDVKMYAFETGKNFEVLMKWNRSLYFVIGVLTIAREITDYNQ